MKFETFKKFWNMYSNEWYKNSKISIEKDGQIKICSVSEFCQLNTDIAIDLYNKYEKIKKVSKALYYKSKKETVNRYKRAAIILYAINLLEPISPIGVYQEAEYKSLYLKQRLAFYVALQSIIMEYPKDIVQQKTLNGKLFDFSIKSYGVGINQSDDFMKGLYKDIYFSGIYRNYNILTMSNVFLLLTERCSQLQGLYLEENGNG